MSRFIGNVSAYAYAVSQGYTGTENEYAELMASYASVAEEAAESAESASQSAESASASAQTATTKASEASTSATQADASATSASQSAQIATTKASEASASASMASTSASTASTKASEASASATAAQTAQTAAEGSATTAQTAAQTATTKAAEAAESARTLTIDPTLTQSGRAADSKVVGDKIGEVKSALNYGKTATAGYILTATNDGTGQTWSPVGTPTDEQTAEAVTTWLANHPEATTTVQDGAITEAKINSSFLQEIKNGYVAPEMFGAVGDGVNDDTEAIQNAVDTGKTVVLFNKTYKTTATLILGNRNRFNFYQLGGQIDYRGSEYAIEVQNVNGGNLIIDRIYAPNGSCIKFNGRNGHGVQYVNFHFLWLSCNEINGTAIRVENDETGWCSQNNVYGGEIQACKYGIYAEVNANAEHACNQWQIYNVGFEGTVPDEVCITLHGTSVMPIRFWSFIKPRTVENAQSILLDLENVSDLRYDGNNGVASRRINVSGTNVFALFNTPLYSDNGFSVLSSSFYISSGVIYRSDVYDILKVASENILNYVNGTCYIDAFGDNIYVHGNLTFSQAQRKIFIDNYKVPDDKTPLNRNPFYIPFVDENGDVVLVQFYADGTTYAQNKALQANTKYYFSGIYPRNLNRKV